MSSKSCVYILHQSMSVSLFRFDFVAPPPSVCFTLCIVYVWSSSVYRYIDFLVLTLIHVLTDNSLVLSVYFDICIALMVDMGEQLFSFIGIPWFMKLNTHFPHLICVLLSFPCSCMNKGIWLLRHLIFIPQWNKKELIIALKFVNTLWSMGKMFQLHFVHKHF